MNLPTERMKTIPFMGIREVFEKAKKLEMQGRSIVHMEIGRPDFDTPDTIKKAALNAIEDGQVHYTSNYGLDKLREIIANKLTIENRVETKPSEVLVTVGAIEGLALAFLGLLDIGDEVLVPSPCFPAYLNQIKLAGASPITVPLRMENGFKLEIKELEQKITRKTKMLLICSPNNPTGSILEYEDLKIIAEFCEQNDLLVLSDECYEKIVFGTEHLSIASFPSMKKRTVIVNSTSKTFSMTGWRVGFVSSSEEIIDSMVRVHQDISTCACSFAQAGAIEAYKNGTDFTKRMVQEFSLRRNLVIQELKKIDSMEFYEPLGAFYVFPSIKRLGVSSQEFCDYILNHAGVALVPGIAFGDFGEGYFRLSYSCSFEDIKEGLTRMKKAL